jgi:hypothetical protein
MYKTNQRIDRVIKERDLQYKNMTVELFGSDEQQMEL